MLKLKKVFRLLTILSLLFLSPMLISAGGDGDDSYNTVQKEYTIDAYGGYTKNECSRYDYCI